MISKSCRTSVVSAAFVAIVLASGLLGGASSSWAEEPSGDCPPNVIQAARGTMSSGFNKTVVPVGRYIWFNANFKVSGIPPDGTAFSWINSRITFKVGDQTFTLVVPRSRITFDPLATCATTAFNPALQSWETVVPVNGNDEIFLSGLAFLVPYDFPGAIKPVTWTGTFLTSTVGTSVSWKWGAAVYADTNMSDYDALGVKPTHSHACDYPNSDHAGTPEDQKSFVVGGARGGGGSNWTGSWTGTQKLTLTCMPRQTFASDRVTNLAFSDTQTLSWDPAVGATVYDILSGDLADLKATQGLGGSFCGQDDLATTQVADDTVPDPDQCLFYVIRGDALSPLAGSYDSAGPAPIGEEGRDATTGTAGGVDCTHFQPEP